MSSREDIIEQLAELLEEVAGVSPDEVTAEATFWPALDLDSLTMVEVVVAAEHRWRLQIPDADADALKTVGQFADYVLEAM